MNSNSGAVQIVAVIRKSLDRFSPKADVVVAGNKDLVSVRLVYEPLEEIYCLILCPGYSEVSGVYKNVSRRKILQLMMLSMRIRYVQDCHLFFNQFSLECGSYPGETTGNCTRYAIIELVFFMT
jgi:hypothetical protein